MKGWPRSSISENAGRVLRSESFGGLLPVHTIGTSTAGMAPSTTMASITSNTRLPPTRRCDGVIGASGTRGPWQIRLFGTYSRTIDLFKHKYQEDLKEAYEKDEKTGAVPFRIGYNVKFNETNLLMATRKDNIK